MTTSKQSTLVAPPRRRRFAVLAVVAVVLAAAALLAAANTSRVSAGGRDMRAARSEYPDIVNTQLDSCALCHVSDSNYRMDPYGDDYAEAGDDFGAIESLDSDGDGYDNITEINALTFPGKADSVPTSESPTPNPDLTDTPAPGTPTHEPPTDTPTATDPPPATDTPTQTATNEPDVTDTPTSEPEHVLYVPWSEKSS